MCKESENATFNPFDNTFCFEQYKYLCKRNILQINKIY